APWQTEVWLAGMRGTLRPNAYLRMIENRFVSPEAPLVDMDFFDRCVDPNARMVLYDKRLPIYVGVCASTQNGTAALFWTRWDATTNRVRLVWHRVFQPTPDQPLNFEETVEATVLELSERFALRRVVFDPWQLQATMQRLRARNIFVEEFPQTTDRLTASSQNLFEIVKSGNLTMYPDDDIRLAFSRAVARETSRGWRISKEKQSHKIDVVVALGMAALVTSQRGARAASTYQGPIIGKQVFHVPWRESSFYGFKKQDKFPDGPLPG